MTKIKICGLRRTEDIIYVNDLKPDYVGFVFAKNSRRYVEEQKARQFRYKLLQDIETVGVFVDEDIEHIEKLIKLGVISMVQLHGSEDEEYIKRLRQNINQPIIKAFNISSKTDIEVAQKSSADYILLDHGKGGTGEVFDWTLIQDVGRPFFLAGGLSSLNVSEAIESTSPYAVDVSSGVEDGLYKSYDKIQKFINHVRNIDERGIKNAKSR